MNIKNLHTKSQLLNALEVTEQELLAAISLPYSKGTVIKNGKFRRTDKPNKMLKIVLSKILDELQKIEPPEYCQCGFKKQSHIKNAQKHLSQREIITLDISSCYPNSKAIYARNFFEDKLNITGDALEIMLQLTTYRGHLPTGASTSPILLFLSHQDLFDKIYNRMKQQGITMTLYMDDITLSAKQHISGKAVKYIKNMLAEHEFRLNPDKIRRFGRNIGFVTGVVLKPGGKLDLPFKKNYEVIEILKSKEIKKMSLKELQQLLGKINYVQRFHPERYVVTKRETIKQINKLLKSYVVQDYE